MALALPIQLPEIEVTPPDDDNSVKLAADKPGDLDDLAAHFSGKSTNTKIKNNDLDDLAAHFGGSSNDNAPAPATIQPQQVHPPISGLTPQASDAANAGLEQAEAANAANPDTTLGAIGSAAALPAIQYWKNVKQEFTSAKEMYQKGATDLVNYKPASAIGEMGLGALGNAWIIGYWRSGYTWAMQAHTSNRQS